jgi:hypothetical protein
MPKRPAAPVAAPPKELPSELETPPPAPVESPIAEPVKKPKLRKQKRAKRKKRSLGKIFVIFGVILVIILVGLVGWFVVKPRYIQTKNNQATAAGTATFSGINFPIYYPSNLPPGYTFNNDAKVIQENVLYYSITDPSGNKFYVTLQKLPPAFNFAAFNDKFLKPDQYTTAVGSVIAGQVGSSYIGSIQTSSNVWIIINSETKNSLPQLEAITRSFQAASK